MSHSKTAFFSISLLLLSIISSCRNSDKKQEDVIVKNPEQINEQTSKSIRGMIEFAADHNGILDDSTSIRLNTLVKDFYTLNEFKNVWSNKAKWNPLADSLLRFIQHSELSGLFPKDYQLKKLLKLKKLLDSDSVQRMNAVTWGKADLLLSDACLNIIKDLKFGRLNKDSIGGISDTTKKGKYMVMTIQLLLKQPALLTTFEKVEPANRGYFKLKNGIKRFVDSMDQKTYTYVTYPIKKNDLKDSMFFVKVLTKRLFESKCIDSAAKLPDSIKLSIAIKKFQKKKGIKPDGLISTNFIRLININDVEKFKRIAITLDRYKLLPDSMPLRYIWVNLPGYYLDVWDNDTLAMQSKIICGKPDTRTPLLTSAITDMITYPTWTVPTSIIAKQYLPKLKINPNYLARIGLKLVKQNGDPIDAAKIKWSKYTKGIPYQVVQNSGDDNALGVIKFNFDNAYAVYLHDTNQRYLFKKTARALSHGCVRVQEWQKLAYYIARNDSLNLKEGDKIKYNVDSIETWINQKKHVRIPVKNKFPLFITYFGCEGNGGKIRFYEDIYGDDKILREKYFSDK